MPKQITVTIDKTGIIIIAVVLALGVSAAKLASETLTLTTYYPAPYGAYRKIVTTDATVLARDGGAVAIATGTTGLSYGAGALARSVKLDVGGYSASNDYWLKGRGIWASQLGGVVESGVAGPVPYIDGSLQTVTINLAGQYTKRPLFMAMMEYPSAFTGGTGIGVAQCKWLSNTSYKCYVEGCGSCPSGTASIYWYVLSAD